MMRAPLHYPRQLGFSLIEMAVVLMIVGLLLAGLVPTLSGQMEQRQVNETRKQLEEINSALLGYAASQQPPKLPCPAGPTIATNLANAGISNCNISSGRGVIPWVTLGISETDAWGRRYTYSVASSVANAGTFTTSFTLSSRGNLDVKNTIGGSNVATDVPAIVVSHGKMV